MAVPQSKEQRQATQDLTTAAKGFRVVTDPEGWPVSPGRYGRLEHLGRGQLAAYITSARLTTQILALPGVSRHQMGDRESRVLLSPAACLPVAKLLRCHRKRSATPAQLATLAKHAFGSAPGGGKSPQAATKGPVRVPAGPPQGVGR